jgi:hypothetical protein
MPRDRPALLSRLILACVLALAILAHCGRKTLPKPPELVVPETISSLAGASTPEGVALTWNRPERCADGSRMIDLAGFRVERQHGQLPFTQIADLPVEDRDRFRQIRHFRHLDANVERGASYRYRVFSYTLDEYVSEPSNVVEIACDEPAEPDLPASPEPLAPPSN